MWPLCSERGDGDVVDVDLLLADEEEKQVERPLEDVEPDLIAVPVPGRGGRRNGRVLDGQGFGGDLGHARKRDGR